MLFTLFSCLLQNQYHNALLKRNVFYPLGLIAMQIVSVLSAEVLRTSEYDSVKIMVKVRIYYVKGDLTHHSLLGLGED